VEEVYILKFHYHIKLWNPMLVH